MASQASVFGDVLSAASAAMNIIATPFNAINQSQAYKTEASNYAASAAALRQEKQNTLRIYDRESRQLASNQTLAFIMSGLESGQGGTVENVKMISGKERAIDRSNIVSNYDMQIQNAERAEAAARKKAKHSLLGGMIETAVGAGVGALTIFSDERLKERLVAVGRSKTGLTIYLGKYTKESGLDDGKFHLFILAQEAQRVRPNSVKIADNGYFMVDYAAALL